jgi:hypothetical protein
MNKLSRTWKNVELYKNHIDFRNMVCDYLLVLASFCKEIAEGDKFGVDRWQHLYIRQSERRCSAL